MTTPEHYTGGIEPLEYIESWDMDFAEGNVVKYITRWRRKSAVLSSQKDDLLKAQAYIGHLIDRVNREIEARTAPPIEPPYYNPDGLEDGSCES